MSAAWTVPTKDNVQDFMAVAVLDGTNATPFGGSERISQVLAAVVARVRGAIEAGGKVGLSATAMSVPPEAVQHTLVLTAEAMVASTPQVDRFTMGDAFVRMVERAEKWLQDVQSGDVEPTEATDEASSPAQLATVVISGGTRLTRDDFDGL